MSAYADSVSCTSCGAKQGAPCTFVHFLTKQRIQTSYCAARLQRWNSERWLRTKKAPQ